MRTSHTPPSWPCHAANPMTDPSALVDEIPLHSTQSVPSGRDSVRSPTAAPAHPSSPLTLSITSAHADGPLTAPAELLELLGAGVSKAESRGTRPSARDPRRPHRSPASAAQQLQPSHQRLGEPFPHTSALLPTPSPSQALPSSLVPSPGKRRPPGAQPQTRTKRGPAFLPPGTHAQPPPEHSQASPTGLGASESPHLSLACHRSGV